MIQSVNNIQNQAIQNKKLEQVSEEFEAFFYNAIFKSARSVSLESEFIKKSEGEKTFTEMLDYELSKTAAKNTEGGIKELLMNFFEENYSPAKGKKYPKGALTTAKNIINIRELLA